MEVCSLAPFLRGEGWGEGRTHRRCELLDLYPLTRIASGDPIRPPSASEARRAPRKRGEVAARTWKLCGSPRNPHGQALVAAHEAGVEPLWLADHLATLETLQALITHTPQL